MKEIGSAFKEAREEIGISKEEVIKDLEITESQFENLEDGNVNAFKDVFFLKDIIKKYTKYLNLNEDEIMDKFNDFIFGYTSRIPINEILNQTREINILESKNEENKVVSPYTIKRKEKKNKKYILIYGIATIAIIVLVILIVNFAKKEEMKIDFNNYIELVGGKC